VSVIVALAVWEGSPESVTSIVIALPAVGVVGVPDMVPFALSNERPAGSVPCDSLQE
jgi:hypothetical protein